MECHFFTKFSLEVIITEAVCFEWTIKRVASIAFFFLIKSEQSDRGETSTGVMLFIWESQRLYLQKKNKFPESGRWHFFHSARSISGPLFGGSAQINLALPPFPRTPLRPPRPFLSTPCSTYRFLLYGSLGNTVAIVFFSPNPQYLIIMISKSHESILLTVNCWEYLRVCYLNYILNR